MNYLNLNDIKKQCCIDEWYDGDDAFLESIGEASEEYVEQLVNEDLQEIEGQHGQLPKPLYHAMLIYVDYLYSTARGSSGTDNEVPEAINTMLKLYRNFK